MLKTDAECVILSAEISATKAGKPMAKVSLQDCKTKEQINGILWQECLETVDKKILKNGNTVKITTSDYNEKFKTSTVSSVELIEEGKIGLDTEEREALFNSIFELIDSFKDERLKTEITKLIHENINLFKTAPAARSMHHAYAGGLMQHIWECIGFARAVFPLFKQTIDQEIILAACIMHDIGKIYEYKIDLESGTVEYNNEFTHDWISHTQFGYSWAMNNGFKELARIIAAHHGRADWGAIIDLNDKNIGPALYLMHHIDDLSAKFGMIRMS